MTVKSHSDLILGDALTVILEEEQRNNPVISEYQFEQEVLDILTFPFGKEALSRYMVYVGELTKPLNVVANDDRENILFTVPALVQSPITTVTTGKGISAEQFMQSLNRERDLGGRHITEKVRWFMMNMTKRPDYLQAVIYPIQHILKRYNRTMDPIPGVDNIPAPTTGGSATPTTTSFSDEYDD